MYIIQFCILSRKVFWMEEGNYTDCSYRDAKEWILISTKGFFTWDAGVWWTKLCKSYITLHLQSSRI